MITKINFLFQMLPIFIQVKILKDWLKQINNFIWNGKKPRIQFKVLQNEKKRGSLAVHNTKLYYQADGLVWFAD